MDNSNIARYIKQFQDMDDYVCWSAADALGRIGTPAVPDLLAVLRDGCPRSRVWAAKAVGYMGAPALPYLIAALKDDAPEIRQGAVIALEHGGHRSAVPLILEKLRDSDAWVRADATVSLGKLGDSSVTPALLEMLDDPHDRVRRSAIEAMARLRDRSVVPRLIELLKGNIDALKAPAALALGTLGDTSAVPILIEALHWPDYELRSAACEALERMGDSPILACKIIVDERFSVRRRVDLVDALRRASRLACPTAEEACELILKEEDPFSRKAAQTALNWLRGDCHLLSPSQRDDGSAAGELLRAAPTEGIVTVSDRLLRASKKPD